MLLKLLIQLLKYEVSLLHTIWTTKVWSKKNEVKYFFLLFLLLVLIVS